MRIFTLGDIKRDTFVALPDASLLCAKKDSSCTLCFSYGEKIPVGAFFSQYAGTAPNVAIALRKLGFSSGVISTVGTDRDGDEAIDFLSREGVFTDFILRKKTASLTQAVVLNFQGESTQLVAHNTLPYFLPKKLGAVDLLHISELGAGYKKVYRDILAFHKKTDSPLSINPGTLQIRERSRELLALLRVCRVLFVNVREAEHLTDLSRGTDKKRLLRALLALGPQTVIMTDGAHGAYGAEGTSLFSCPAFSAVQKEATGAGDAFSAGVLGALLLQKSIPDALAWGAVNSASVVEFIGPTAGLLHKKAILHRLLEHPSFVVSRI